MQLEREKGHLIIRMAGGRNHSPLISRKWKADFLKFKNMLSAVVIKARDQLETEVIHYHKDPVECDNLDLSELLPPYVNSLQNAEKTLAWFCETVGYVTKREGSELTSTLREILKELKHLIDAVLIDEDIEIPRPPLFEGLEETLNNLTRDFLKSMEEADKENRRNPDAVSDSVMYAVRNYVIVRRVELWQDGFFRKYLPN